MERTVNFSRHRPPILNVPLMDDQQTVLHVVPPSVDLQEELRARQTELRALLTGDDEETVAALYDLAAKLMSCNRNWRKITGVDLRKVYNLDEEDLVVFFDAYADYMKDIENAKN